MSRNSQNFTLIDGSIEVSNNQINIKKKKKNLKSGVVTTILLIAFFYRLVIKSNFFSQTEKTTDYFYLVLLILISIIILALIIYFALFHHWKNSVEIATISKIEIEKEDNFEIEISIITNNNRQKHLNFRNLENQLEPFLRELKKRNSRIEIKHI